MRNYITQYKTTIILLTLALITATLGIYQLATTNPSQAETIEIVHETIEATAIPRETITPKSNELKKLVTIDISGAVTNPGVYDLPEHSRISDALEVVDGLDKNADTEWLAKNLNMATLLKDTDKIYIPFKSENTPDITSSSSNKSAPTVTNPKIQTPQIAGVTTTVLGYQSSPSNTQEPQPTENISQPNSKISINNATSKELEALNGVGPVTAKKIIDNRPYVSLEELKEKKAVGKSLYDKIIEHITL